MYKTKPNYKGLRNKNVQQELILCIIYPSDLGFNYSNHITICKWNISDASFVRFNDTG